MTDFTSLQSKVNDLKAKVAQYSITPAYLGALLDDLITLMKKIDMTGMSDDVQTALRNANSALEKSQSALTKAVNAENSANLATQSALNAIQKASDALSKAENAVTVANTAKNTADAAKSMAANAQGNANTANNTADEALSRIEAVEDKIGTPNGIATLDEHGLIPSNQLPSYIDDVVEFDGMLPILGDIKIESASASSGSIYYVPSLDTFVCMSRNDGGIVGSGAKYYANWGGADAFGEFTMNGRKPASSKIFIDVSTNNQYRYSGSTLVSTGSPLSLGETEHTAYSGDKGKQLRVDVNELQSKFGGLMIFPFNGTYIRVSDTGNHMPPTQGVWWTPSSEGGCFLFCSSQFGYSVLDYNLDGLGRSDRIFRCGNIFYRVVDGELKELGGATEGNCLNVTVELPKQGTTNPYYDLSTAIARIYEARRTKLGLQITFATTAKSWKQYQYIGASLESEDFLSESNWIDMAGTSAGTEPVININDLCGDPTAADFYSFESAVDALAKLETDTKVIYRKAGMVITYRISASEWETLQLVQKVSDFGNRAAWKEFGGGSKVESKDEPVAGGKLSLIHI